MQGLWIFGWKNNVIIKYLINIEEKTQTIQHIRQHNPIKHYINTSFYMIWSQISKSTSPRLWSGDYCWWLFWRQFSFTEYELWQAKTGRVESSQPRLESGNKPSPKAEWSQVFYAKDMRVWWSTNNLFHFRMIRWYHNMTHCSKSKESELLQSTWDKWWKISGVLLHL